MQIQFNGGGMGCEGCVGCFTVIAMFVGAMIFCGGCGLFGLFT